MLTMPSLNHHFPTYLAPIKTPPVFDGPNYNNWKEEIQFWKDIHGHIDDAQLLAELALGARKIYRNLIMRFKKETKGDKTKRSPDEFLLRMGNEFLRDAGDRSMGKLTRFQNSKRGNGASMRGFWIRFETLTDSLDRHGLILNQ